MKKILFLLSLTILFSCADKKEVLLSTEISCGQCQFSMTTQEGCDLAVRIDGEPYFVDGFNIDAFGDAHAEHTGFCEAIRKAKIKGAVVDARYKATSIVLED